MRALRPGLWHWKAPHPDWRPSEPWDQNVSSYAIDDGERLLLFDPIAPPSEIEKLAAERETAVVLTAPWHERDTQRLVERLGVPVSTPLPDTAEYLMQTYGLTAEQAGDGSPDVVWLLKEGIGEAHPYAAGDRLDVGVEAFPGQKPNDMVLWIESHRTVIAGDTLVDFGKGLEINARWLHQQGSRASRSSRDCVRCSSCRSSTCSRRTAGRMTGPPWSARCPRPSRSRDTPAHSRTRVRRAGF